MGNYLSYDTTNIKRKYTLKTDVYDSRDQVHDFPIMGCCRLKFIDKASLRDKFKFQVYDQGDLGSCTANSISGALQYDDIIEGLKSEDAEHPSRLFIYYNERKLEGDTSTDAGASIRDSVKAVNKFGFCKESLWPYRTTYFATKPPSKAYKDAEQHKDIKYKRVNQVLDDIRYCIAIKKLPVLIGFKVYKSMESGDVAKTGVVPLPVDGDNPIGGHAVLLVGYDDTKQLFCFRNSWSESWGDNGYGYLPYSYVLDNKLANDFWTIKKIR